MKDLKIFAKTIEQEARDQIDLLLAQKPFESCKVRIMPDVHAGAGCVIGFTANLGDKVIPNIVGVDIGCGMLVVPLGNISIDFQMLDAVIRQHIPSGRNVHAIPVAPVDLKQYRCFERLRNTEWLQCSLGTLGGGNHFIEIDADEDGNKYLVIHTGSRNLGKQVAEIYQSIAVSNLHSNKAERKALIERLKAEGREREISEAIKALDAKTEKVPADLCYLEGKDREDYLHDMMLCQEFAAKNREIIAHVICGIMGCWFIDRSTMFHTVHNYIDNENMVRKGAISAKAGQPLLIPINMRDGCILGEGLGNLDWNESAPHGAGRLMSRNKARSTISLEEYKNSMQDVFTTSVDTQTLDEAPQAYKPMSEIVECIAETVSIKKILKPVYNFKASE